MTSDSRTAEALMEEEIGTALDKVLTNTRFIRIAVRIVGLNLVAEKAKDDIVYKRTKTRVNQMTRGLLTNDERVQIVSECVAAIIKLRG